MLSRSCLALNCSIAKDHPLSSPVTSAVRKEPNVEFLILVGFGPGIVAGVGIDGQFGVSPAGIDRLDHSFGFPHRRVRALVQESRDGSEVLIAPLARRDWAGQRDFVTTLTSLEPAWGPGEPYGRMVNEQR